MDLVPGFQELLPGLSPTMTAPSLASLCTIISGWLFSGRGIVTRMIVAAGSEATKHFSSYHRLMSAASWTLDAMGLAVLTMIEPFLGDGVMLGLDDTLARKRGLRMFGTGMHHDPLASTRSLAFVLVDQLRILCAAHENRRFHVVADSAYGGQNVFAVPDRPLRVVAGEALEGGRGKEAFSSTCHEATAEEVIRWYAMRWSVEVTFRDSKQYLGFEEPQC